MRPFSIQDIDGILMDLDGVLYVGQRPIAGAVSTLQAIRDRGIPCRFVTNTTTRPLDQLHRDIAKIGLPIEMETIFSPPKVAARYIRELGNPRVRLILEEGTKTEFERCTIDEVNPEYIVLGHYGNRWSYDLLQELFEQVMSGAEMIALHKGRFWEVEEGLALDIGCFIVGLEHATGKTATIIGKPSKTFFHMALADMGVGPEGGVMIGDDIVSDVGGAQAAGLYGVLVRTGKYRDEHVARSGVDPDLVIDSIADLARFL